MACLGGTLVWGVGDEGGRAIVCSRLEVRIGCASAVNDGGEIRFARKLIEARQPVSAAALEDGSIKLKDLAARPVHAGAAA